MRKKKFNVVLSVVCLVLIIAAMAYYRPESATDGRVALGFVAVLLLILVVDTTYHLGMGRISSRVNDYGQLPDGVYHAVYERWAHTDQNTVLLLVNTENGAFHAIRVRERPLKAYFEIRHGWIQLSEPKIPEEYRGY